MTRTRPTTLSSPCRAISHVAQTRESGLQRFHLAEAIGLGFEERRQRSLLGQGGEALPVIDALGCLRSLRARWGLTGKLGQGGKVENAVGR
jgi:hypothetical protein